MLLSSVRNLMIKQVKVGKSRISRVFSEMRKPNYADENATVFGGNGILAKNNIKKKENKKKHTSNEDVKQAKMARNPNGKKNIQLHFDGDGERMRC